MLLPYWGESDLWCSMWRKIKQQQHMTWKPTSPKGWEGHMVEASDSSADPAPDKQGSVGVKLSLVPSLTNQRIAPLPTVRLTELIVITLNEEWEEFLPRKRKKRNKFTQRMRLKIRVFIFLLYMMNIVKWYVICSIIWHDLWIYQDG